MNTKEIREHKKHLKLSSRQREILVGLLLGDGHLETQDDGRTYRLKVEHGIQQSDYVLWLYTEFSNWVRQKPFRKKRGVTESIGFTTYSHGSFRFYGHQFYLNRKKIIPKLIYRLLTPIGIAIWFMDDGSRKSLRHKTYNIHSIGYKKIELERIQEVLLKRFQIKTRLHRQKGRYWRIYIPSESARDFERIVVPHMRHIQSMEHKLGNAVPKE